MIKNLRV
jgi:hypothetical protein